MLNPPGTKRVTEDYWAMGRVCKLGRHISLLYEFKMGIVPLDRMGGKGQNAQDRK